MELIIEIDWGGGGVPVPGEFTTADAAAVPLPGDIIVKDDYVPYVVEDRTYHYSARGVIVTLSMTPKLVSEPQDQ